MKFFLLLIFFGSCGVLCRYGFDRYFSNDIGWPTSTFVINILGSFLIGILYVFVFEKALIDKDLGQCLIVGFLGGFTTFSAFSLQVVLLFDQGRSGLALAYFAASPLLSATFAFLGVLCTRFLFRAY